MTEATLLQGHSVLCVAWHLRRLNYPTKPVSLANHWRKHMTMFSPVQWGGWEYIGERHGGGCLAQKPGPAQWLYTPYPPGDVRINEQPALVLIRGLLGSGKSEVARTYGQTHRHVEADQYFLGADGMFYYSRREVDVAQSWCLSQAHDALAHGENVVVANTFTRNIFLEPYLGVAATVGATVALFEIVPVPPRAMRCPFGASTSVLHRQYRAWEDFDLNVARWHIPFSFKRLYSYLAPLNTDVPPLPYLCQPGTCERQTGTNRPLV